jgi:hypothetical protein
MDTTIILIVAVLLVVFLVIIIALRGIRLWHSKSHKRIELIKDTNRLRKKLKEIGDDFVNTSNSKKDKEKS